MVKSRIEVRMISSATIHDKLNGPKFSVMPDLIRYPEKPTSELLISWKIVTAPYYCQYQGGAVVKA
jgi:hypothetical protein